MAKYGFELTWAFLGVCLIACLLFSGLVQLIAGLTFFYLLAYTLIMVFSCGALGYVSGRFIGHRKGILKNSAGVALDILIVTGAGIAYFLLALKVPVRLSAAEETLKSLLSLWLGAGVAALGYHLSRSKQTDRRSDKVAW
jgi:hypothetical protein